MKKIFTLALLLLLALTACGTEIDPEAMATDAAALVATTITGDETEPTPTPVPWGYEGEDGPEHWGDAYETCNGPSQSPIDIVTTEAVDLVDLTFDYQPDTLELIHNGHTVQVNHHADSFVTLDNVAYKLAQFHFHAPSEHTVNGEKFDAELHLVHTIEVESEGKTVVVYAVVGIMIKIGPETPVLSTVWEHLPSEKGSAKRIEGVMIDPTQLLPVERTTFRYSGSLTTPPCSEGVHWNLLTTPITMSQKQIDDFAKAIEHPNNRPLQPPNDRPVTEDSSSD
jgi:carbonic anhydrase